MQLLLGFLLYILAYPLVLTAIVKFLNPRNQTELKDVFTFICLSIIICYFSPGLYILFMANIRFR